MGKRHYITYESAVQMRQLLKWAVLGRATGIVVDASGHL